MFGKTGSSTERLVIQTDGTISAGGVMRASNFVQSSDARLKKVHANCTYGLEEISRLQPKTFAYLGGNARGHPSEKIHAGFVAQEVRPSIDACLHVS